MKNKIIREIHLYNIKCFVRRMGEAGGVPRPTTITNDDAIADCIFYAEDIKADLHTFHVPFKLTRKIRPPAPPTAECSITMCGNDQYPLVQYCENRHYVHTKCLENMFVLGRDSSSGYCPQCRSQRAAVVATLALPVIPESVDETFAELNMAYDIFASMDPDDAENGHEIALRDCVRL